MAPAHWQAELANVVWMAVRAGASPLTRAIDVSTLRAAALTVRSDWLTVAECLTLSLDSGLSAYDTLFVALARRRRLPLVTFDKQVLKGFPRWLNGRATSPPM